MMNEVSWIAVGGGWDMLLRSGSIVPHGKQLQTIHLIRKIGTQAVRAEGASISV